MEHAVHHLPFFIGGSLGRTVLKTRHECLPFLLTRKRGEPVHSLVPIEIERSLDNHKQAVVKNVYLHFENTNLPYAVDNFLPNHPFGMSMTVIVDKLTVASCSFMVRQ